MEGLFQQWKLAFRNLRRNSRRNLVSGLAIAFGFSGLALMGSYILRTDAYLATNTIYLNQTGHISVFKKDGQKKFLQDPAKYVLTLEDQNAVYNVVKELAGVEFTARFLIGQGLLSTSCSETPFLTIGIDDGLSNKIRNHPLVQRWTPDLISPPYDKSLAYYAEVTDGISITDQISQMLNKPRTLEEAGAGTAPISTDCADRPQKDNLAKTADVQLVARAFNGDFSAVDAFIVSHHSTGLAFAEETSVQMGLKLAQKLFQTDGVTYMAVYIQPHMTAPLFYPKFVEALRAATGDRFEALPYFDERIGTFYVGVMSFLGTMASFFFILVMATVAITVVNFLTVGFLERQREMGTLRSIGFPPKSIARMFFQESVLLVGLGLIGGILVSLCVVLVVNQLKIPFRPPGVAGTMPFMLWLTPGLCAAVSLVVGGTGIAAAWLKLRRITQVPIVDLLRG